MSTFSQLAELAGTSLKGPDGDFTGRVFADSRLVAKGDAFAAFRGENADGHDFIPEAVKNGASLIFCEKDDLVPSHIPFIKVRDTFEVLPEMAEKKLVRRKNPLEIIAITGSVGKTTTKEFLHSILTDHFRVHEADHSYNTLIGCSMTILSMPEEAEILLLEMGANHQGEIAAIVEKFPPTISIITEVAPAHLEGFESLQGVLAAKMEIARSKTLRAFFYNGDNELLAKASSKLSARVAALSVGLSAADYQINHRKFHLSEGRPQLSFSLKTPQGTLEVKSGAYGKHGAYPLSFAIAVALFLGVPPHCAIKALEDVSSLDGRGRVKTLASGVVLVDDSYNANPASMAAALEAAAELPSKRRFAVVGEMLELGSGGDQFHKDIIPLLEKFDHLWLVGKTWERIAAGEGALPDNGTLWEGPLQALGEILLKELAKGDGIIVKGSHGNRLDILTDILQRGTAL